MAVSNAVTIAAVTVNSALVKTVLLAKDRAAISGLVLAATTAGTNASATSKAPQHS
ncbi:hypothetical protein [Deinococcus yavapaiensis]|uniref:hypothetical protein n=1 Tax=Deinococcus yavapaiensis TaxID=309889 RepID=UPI0014748683|nr:hypothetical protein [Deinococcus yavapaiensis]